MKIWHSNIFTTVLSSSLFLISCYITLHNCCIILSNTCTMGYYNRLEQETTIQCIYPNGSWKDTRLSRLEIESHPKSQECYFFLQNMASHEHKWWVQNSPRWVVSISDDFIKQNLHQKIQRNRVKLDLIYNVGYILYMYNTGTWGREKNKTSSYSYIY